MLPGPPGALLRQAPLEGLPYEHLFGVYHPRSPADRRGTSRSNMDQHDPKDPGTFPWATWQNGSIWDAAQGEDFTMEPLDFMVMLSRHAKTAELDLKVEEVQRTDGPHVIFQFLPKGMPRLSAIGIVYDHETDEISVDSEGWTDDEVVGLLLATLSQITGICVNDFFTDEESED